MGSETTPEMLAMASRIADQDYDSKSEPHEWRIAYEAALAAIKETSERAANFLDAKYGHPSHDYEPGYSDATALRNGEHYHDR